MFWQRDAQWSAYPDDHIGRSRGVAAKTRPGPAGIIDVYIDGTRDATIDLYGPSKQPNQVVYTKTGPTGRPTTYSSS